MTRDPPYRPDIDGLRAVSILLVVGYHYFGLPGGYIGVDVFFVISGYLITGILLRDLYGGTFSFTRFYARRFRRILPAALFVIASSAVVGAIGLSVSDFKELAEEAFASSVYGINILLWSETGYFDVPAATKPLLHFWSLAVEEQFYFLWPGFLLIAYRIRQRTDLAILVVFIGSLLTALLVIPAAPSDAFYLPFARLWEFALGGILIQLEQARNGGLATLRTEQSRNAMLQVWLPLFGFALIVTCAALHKLDGLAPGYMGAIGAFASALILSGGAYGWLNRIVLALPPMVKVGRRSYSLYLCHWPVLVLATLIGGENLTDTARVGWLAVSVILAGVVYQWIERPIRQIPVGRHNSWMFLGLGIAASAVLAVIGITFSTGVLMRPSDARLITKAYRRPTGDCTFDGRRPHADTSVFAPCEVIQFPMRPVVAIVGDSHAQALYFGLKPFLDSQRVNLLEYTATSCAPFWVQSASPVCAATYNYVLKRIQERKPDLLVLSANFHIYMSANAPDYGEFAVRQMAEIQINAAKRALIVGQVPTWDRALVKIVNQHYLSQGLELPERMMTELAADSLATDSAMQRYSEKMSVPYFSVRNQFCNAQGCLTRVGETLPDDLIQADQSHLTIAGSRFLVGVGLGEKIDSLLPPKSIR